MDAMVRNHIMFLLEYAGRYGRVHDHTIVVVQHEGRSVSVYANHSQMIAVLEDHLDCDPRRNQFQRIR
jgi:hypothetical protein